MKTDGIREILESGEFPGVVVKGEGRKGHHGNVHAKACHAAPNANFRDRSAAGQETVDKKVHQAKRKAALETRRARHGTNRANDEVRPVGHIPFNLYQARRAERGRDYWKNEGKAALKRDGLSFDQ